MNIKLQKKLLQYLISSPDTYALCYPILKASYFDPELRNTVNFVGEYYQDYSTTPESDLIEAATDVHIEKTSISRDEIDFCVTEIEKFCKRKAMEEAVLASPELIEKGDFGKVEEMIKDAVLVSVTRDLGLNFFEDPTTMLDEFDKTEIVHSTGWTPVDEKLFGGISRGQLIIFTANSGGGKSITMSNLGLNLMGDGLTCLYISLELPEEMVALRYGSMITGINQRDWKQHKTDMGLRIRAAGQDHGGLFIKRMPVGTTPSQIRAYLKEFELINGFVPDILITDYLDLMNPNERVSADNVFEKDKRVAEQLREIGHDYGMFNITASQQNRGAVTATEVNHSHIAGGISKINTADIVISIIMNDAMRAAGEIGFMFLKTRTSDGVGSTVFLEWCGSGLRIKNPKGEAGLSFKKKEHKEILGGGAPDNPLFDESKPSGSGLLSLMNS